MPFYEALGAVPEGASLDEIGGALTIALSRRSLAEMGCSPVGERPASTYARRICKRLLIDFSWNPSRLEGNTDSLALARFLDVAETKLIGLRGEYCPLSPETFRIPSVVGSNGNDRRRAQNHAGGGKHGGAGAEEALIGEFQRLHADIHGNQEKLEALRNRRRFWCGEERLELDL